MAVSTYHFLFNRPDDSYNNHSPHPCNFTNAQLRDPNVYYVGPIELDIDQFADITHVKWDLVNEEVYSYYESIAIDGPPRSLIPENLANANAIIEMKESFIELVNNPGANSDPDYLNQPGFPELINIMKSYLGENIVNSVLKDGKIDPAEEALLDKRIQLIINTENSTIESINSANT